MDWAPGSTVGAGVWIVALEHHSGVGFEACYPLDHQQVVFADVD